MSGMRRAWRRSRALHSLDRGWAVPGDGTPGSAVGGRAMLFPANLGYAPERRSRGTTVTVDDGSLNPVRTRTRSYGRPVRRPRRSSRHPGAQGAGCLGVSQTVPALRRVPSTCPRIRRPSQCSHVRDGSRFVFDEELGGRGGRALPSTTGIARAPGEEDPGTMREQKPGRGLEDVQEVRACFTRTALRRLETLTIPTTLVRGIHQRRGRWRARPRAIAANATPRGWRARRHITHAAGEGARQDRPPLRPAGSALSPVFIDDAETKRSVGIIPSGMAAVQMRRPLPDAAAAKPSASCRSSWGGLWHVRDDRRVVYANGRGKVDGRRVRQTRREQWRPPDVGAGDRVLVTDNAARAGSATSSSGWMIRTRR